MICLMRRHEDSWRDCKGKNILMDWRTETFLSKHTLIHKEHKYQRITNHFDVSVIMVKHLGESAVIRKLMFVNLSNRTRPLEI